MSYDIHFERNGERIHLDNPHSLKGGTYALGGTTEAWINITYNYDPWFYEAFGKDGIRSLYGKPANEVAERIKETLPKVIASSLPERPCSCHNSLECYWASIPGNAAEALRSLRELALMCPPDSICNGD